MYGEEGRLLIFFNRIYVFHSYQRFRLVAEITGLQNPLVAFGRGVLVAATISVKVN